MLKKMLDRSGPDKQFPITVLLVDDQLIIAEAIKRMLADQEDVRFYYCNDATDAIRVAGEVKPTVILQDLVMPDVDGLTLVKYFRANPATHDIPLIVLSVKEDPEIKADAFALGANDYAVKLPNKTEFIARIRYHSMAYTRLLERNLAYLKLEESQKALSAELQEASDYVRSLLPDPICNEICTQWQFIPSMQLGGDIFGYHWMDDDHFAFYLLDVCGHGVGAALLSISVVNTLQAESLPGVDFLDPKSVLAGLNHAFPMERHHNMFFTIWYGVYDQKSRELCYSCGGHPPALLFSGSGFEELATTGLVVGGMGDSIFENKTKKIPANSYLYLLSDGVFELTKPDLTIRPFHEFEEILQNFHQKDAQNSLENITKEAYSITNGQPFDDDYSIMQLLFK